MSDGVFLWIHMQQKNITIPKTARYFILNEPTEQIEQVWFVCHGYAQLANYFIKKFDELDPTKHLIVAPEGLHRFYWKGFSERVVASWMTKEDRENDILDYVNYLNLVYDEVMSSFKNRKVKVNVLGFSQGTATVCRWVANGNVQADNFILWAGAFPPDMNFKQDRSVFDTLKTYVVVGDADEFINEEEVVKQSDFLKKNKIDFELIRFKGKHEIDKAVLSDLQKRF